MIYKIDDLSEALAEGCTVNFDMRLLDVFEEMRKHDPLPERMKADYFRIKADLGRRPLRLDMHVGSGIVSREYLRPRHLAPHKGYLRFLADLGELTPEEESWLDTNVEEFLLDLETTSMTKMYKIPTIAAFIDEEKLLPAVSSTEVGRSMQQYYEDPRFHKDMQDKSSRGFEEWSLAQWRRLAEKNPIHFLSKSSPFFQFDEINKMFDLHPEVVESQSPLLVEHVEDILRYRERLMIARLYKEEK